MKNKRKIKDFKPKCYQPTVEESHFYILCFSTNIVFVILNSLTTLYQPYEGVKDLNIAYVKLRVVYYVFSTPASK